MVKLNISAFKIFTQVEKKIAKLHHEQNRFCLTANRKAKNVNVLVALSGYFCRITRAQLNPLWPMSSVPVPPHVYSVWIGCWLH